MAYLGKTPSQGTRNRFYFTASGGETSLSGVDDNGNTLTFADGAFVDVSVNGISLVAGTDYNTTTANTIGGLAALSASDVVEIVAYDVFNIFSGSVNGPLNVSETVTASAFIGDGSALTGIPSPTLTSLGIANHNLLSVDSNGVLTLPDNYIVSGFEPTIPFDINGSGSVSTQDSLDYLKWSLGNLTAFNIPTSETFKAPWSNTTILKGSLVEGNAADALSVAVGNPSNDYGDAFILGNQDANNNLKSGLSINGPDVRLISHTDGESQLYKGTSAKLSTASTGVSVTGDVSVTNGDLSEVLISQTIPSGSPTTIDFDNLPTTYDTYRFDFNLDVVQTSQIIYVRLINSSGGIESSTNAYFYNRLTNGVVSSNSVGTNTIPIVNNTSGANDNKGCRGSLYLYGRNMDFGSSAPTMPMLTWSLVNLSNLTSPNGPHQTVSGGASVNPAGASNFGSGMRGVRFYSSTNFNNQGFISVYGIRSTPV